MYRFLWAGLLISGHKNVFFLLVQKGQLSHNSFISCFQEQKADVSVLVPAVFQENNPYAKMAYLGVAYSATLRIEASGYVV